MRHTGSGYVIFPVTLFFFLSASLPGLAETTRVLLSEDSTTSRLTVYDGESFEMSGRISLPADRIGAPVMAADGHSMFLLSRDGWVRHYDLETLTEVAQVRAGRVSTGIALSSDEEWLAVANAEPQTLTILSTTDLSVADTLDIEDKHGTTSGVLGVYTRPTDESFILALADAPEIWEVFYGANPPFYGFVHDYRIEGPPPEAEAFPMRRITVPERLESLTFDPSHEYIIAAKQDGTGAVVVDLVIGHKIADLALPDRPRPDQGVTWQDGPSTLMAVPYQGAAVLSLIDLKAWEPLAAIPLDGRLRALYSHETSPYLWALLLSDPNKNAVHVIDKRSRERVEIVQSDAMISDVAFTSDGTYVIISLLTEDGAVVVLNAKTLERSKRPSIQ